MESTAWKDFVPIVPRNAALLPSEISPAYRVALSFCVWKINYSMMVRFGTSRVDTWVVGGRRGDP